MSVTRSYACALYEAAREFKCLDPVETQLKEFLAILDQSQDVRATLCTPVASLKEKEAVVGEIAKKAGFTPVMAQFLALLARKNRLNLFEEISKAFFIERFTSEGGISGHLVSAEPLSESDSQALTEAFSKKLGKKASFQVTTEPSLLAGLKVTVNGVTYDGTLHSQIQKLRDYFVAGLPGAHG